MKNILEQIEIIKHAGFFKEYEDLTGEDLIKILHKEDQDRMLKLLGYEYDYSSYLTSIYNIITKDDKKLLQIDLEAEVCAQNKVYTLLLTWFSERSNGHFSPKNIEEIWYSEQGPIKLSFISNDETIIFEPKYLDDWIDSRVFTVINEEMKKNCNEYFYVCTGKNDEWIGQDIIMIRLTASEKLLLTEKLEWKFDDI